MSKARGSYVCFWHICHREILLFATRCLKKCDRREKLHRADNMEYRRIAVDARAERRFAGTGVRRGAMIFYHSSSVFLILARIFEKLCA